MSLRVGVFHPGTQHSWQTALAFQEAGQLGWYATSIFYRPSQFPYSLETFVPPQLRARLHERLLRRFTADLDPRLVRCFGAWEWIERAAAALGSNQVVASANRRGNRSFAAAIARQTEREPVDILWGYDTSALQAFRWAKGRGIACVLERTSVHPNLANEVAALEYDRHPEFFIRPWRPKAQNLIDEEDEEIDLADRVIVGSNYCADSLVRNGCSAKKISVVGYGYDERGFPAGAPVRAPGNRPLQCVFVGNVGALKGIAYLLTAFAELPAASASLVVIGSLQLPQETFARYAGRVRYVGALPRSAVIQHYRNADCLVFPSLIEGSAVVLREIYGAGLGALQTQASGDGIVAGANGQFIEPSSVNDIVQSVEKLARDPSEAERWSVESWSRRDHFTWSQYRAKIRDIANSLAA